jgi:hypothetical protein
MCFSFILCVRREMGFNKKKKYNKKLKKAPTTITMLLLVCYYYYYFGFNQKGVTIQNQKKKKS